MAIVINSDNGNIVAGGDNTDGDLILNGNDGSRRIHLNAGAGNAHIGGNGADGDLLLMPASATGQSEAASTIHMSGDSGNIRAGGNGVDGDVVLRSANGVDVIRLDGGNGNIFAGGDGADGDLVLRGEDGADRIQLRADSGNIAAGGNGVDGDLILRSVDGVDVIHLDAGGGNIFAGGDGVDGDLVLRGEDGSDRIRLSAGSGNVFVGGNGQDGDILVFAATGDNETSDQATIRISGDSGDIVLQNADFAEDFDIAGAEGLEAEPGTVMTLRDDGALEPCSSAYDPRVIGVISGAGGYKPGIVMDKRADRAGRKPVALVGKVYCLVDADRGAVRTGDLLTTSPTPGHAMRAADRERAFGAVLGKALAPLEGGRGLVPVLVNLQ
jgi:hypothetical protein